MFFIRSDDIETNQSNTSYENNQEEQEQYEQ